MKKYKKKIGLVLLLTLFLVGVFGIIAFADDIQIPNVNVQVGSNTDGSPQSYVSNIKLLILLTILTLLPSILIMFTCFTRIVVVFSFLKNALGAQQSIPNQILIGLSLFLTMFIMFPVFNQMNEKGIQPYLDGQITQEQAIEDGGKPLKEFMSKQTRKKDVELFVELSNEDVSNLDENNLPFHILAPAFAISELKTAFQIGFLLYLPFIVIDLVVGSVLMSMGMMMLPPTTISLPFKILLFILVDGWNLVIGGLVKTFY